MNLSDSEVMAIITCGLHTRASNEKDEPETRFHYFNFPRKRVAGSIFSLDARAADLK